MVPIIYTNGDYVGAWKNGKRNGQGTYTFASGNKYVGDYQDDKRNGQGITTIRDQWNGDRYVGGYKDIRDTVREPIPMLMEQKKLVPGRITN